MTTDSSKEPMCYIGTKPECGCIIGSILVGSVPLKMLGKQVGAWIEEGYNAEFVTHSYVTENWGVCDHRVKQLPLKEQPPAPPPAEEKPALTYDVATDGTVENVTLNGMEPHDEEPEQVREVTPAEFLQLLREGYVYLSPFGLGDTTPPPESLTIDYYRVLAMPVEQNGTKTGKYQYQLQTFTYADPPNDKPFDTNYYEDTKSQIATLIADLNAIVALEDWEDENEVIGKQTPSIPTDYDDIIMAEFDSTEQG